MILTRGGLILSLLSPSNVGYEDLYESAVSRFTGALGVGFVGTVSSVDPPLTGGLGPGVNGTTASRGARIT